MMHTIPNEFLGCQYYSFIRPNSNEAVFFFHGYPDDGDRKNIDIAKNVFLNTDLVDCFCFVYNGLGKNQKSFNFLDSINDSILFCKKHMTKKYDRVHIVGHSWGGLVGINVVEQLQNSIPINNLFLISPFCNLSENDDELKALVETVYNSTISFLTPQTSSDIFNQIKFVRAQCNPNKKIKSITGNVNITILQALNDNEAPAEITKKMLSNSTHNEVLYTEIQTDHSFSDKRIEISNIIVNKLMRK